MVSKLDVVLTVGLLPKSSPKAVLEKMGKKSVLYNSIYNLLAALEAAGTVKKDGEKYSLAETVPAKRLFWLVYFCFKNGIDYNAIISEKAAAFVKKGLESMSIKGLPFHPKTVQKILAVLSRHGFVVVESKKPFVCRIVYSKFLEALVEHFFGKPNVACYDFLDCVNEEKVNSQLEKEFSAFKRLSKKPLDFDEIGFIHSSLSLEGNTLTLPETEKLIKEHIPPKSKPFKDAQQVTDYKKAIDNFIYSDSELNLENVLEFHRTAMNSLQAGAGEIRRQNVRIKGNPKFRTPDWKQVPELLTGFFGSTEQALEQKKISASQLVEKAAFLHNEFQRIHPFVDGNSRTARAIFTKFLAEKGFPLIKIPIGFSEQYMKLTKLSEKRDDKKFAVLMKQITLENLAIASQKIKYSAE
ncbi:MAG TPA: Fic family protein [archaeon]|nr:Fic family protein [archaeon]